MPPKKKPTHTYDISDFLEFKETIEYDINVEDSLIMYLKECDRRYYTEGMDPIIPDSEYDRLRDLAQNKWSDNDYFSNDNVGFEVSGEKVQHEFVLGSLTKYKIDTVNDWLGKYDPEGEIYILPKFDGLSVYVEFNNGKVIHAATRGDGHLGKDITPKIQLVIPKISYMGHVKLRGEIVLPGEAYKEFGFANRRNGASGIIGAKTSYKAEDIQKLSVIFYEVISPEMKLGDSFNILPQINEIFVIPAKMKIGTLMKAPNHLIEMLEETKNDYASVCEIDGLVLIHDGIDNEYSRENIYKPSNKTAFKHTDESAEATVDFVEWNTSRNGRVVPIVNFKAPYPILSGANIRKATGYNAKFILDNKIIKGTRVKIIRSGDVIPAITEVLK